jgi:hypothetical protein
VLSNLLAIVALIWKAMIPPTTATDQEQYWHRVRVALVACAAFCGLILSQIMNYGVTPWFDGFAKQSEVRYLRVHQLDEELLSLRIQNCTATTGAAKQEYLRRILILEEEYFNVEHIQYQEPPCSDL